MKLGAVGNKRGGTLHGLSGDRFPVWRVIAEARTAATFNG